MYTISYADPANPGSLTTPTTNRVCLCLCLGRQSLHGLKSWLLAGAIKPGLSISQSLTNRVEEGLKLSNILSSLLSGLLLSPSVLPSSTSPLSSNRISEHKTTYLLLEQTLSNRATTNSKTASDTLSSKDPKKQFAQAPPNGLPR